MLVFTLLHITNDNQLTKKWINFVKIKFHSNESDSNTLNKTQIQILKMGCKVVHKV
jgi:hypothetical protein